MLRHALLLLVLLLAGRLPADPETSPEAVTLRFDSLKTVVMGSVANPFVIGLGPEEMLTIGKPVYLHVSFKYPGTDRKMKQPDQRRVREVLQADRVLLDVQVPHEKAEEKPFRVTGWLRPDFCCGKGLDGSFVIPEQARKGEVTLKITWPASGNLRAGSTTIDVTLLAPM